jgi:hypothetical protein
MAFDLLTGDRHHQPPGASGDRMSDHRTRIALEESQRLERKHQELLEQTSERNTPAERIRIWERRHGLTLPRDSNHRLLAIVACQTDLALDQVREEQQRRLARVNAQAEGIPTAASCGVT